LKYILLLTLSTLLLADKVKVESLACPSTEIMREAFNLDLSDYLTLNLFTIKHSCKLLNASSAIEVIDYDVNSRSKLIRIQDKNSLQELYVLRKNIEIEQPGANNSFKF